MASCLKTLGRITSLKINITQNYKLINNSIPKNTTCCLENFIDYRPEQRQSIFFFEI